MHQGTEPEKESLPNEEAPTRDVGVYCGSVQWCPPARTYTEAEVNERVAAAVKFVNECNARQLEIIQQLRKELKRSTT